MRNFILNIPGLLIRVLYSVPTIDYQYKDCETLFPNDECAKDHCLIDNYYLAIIQPYVDDHTYSGGVYNWTPQNGLDICTCSGTPGDCVVITPIPIANNQLAILLAMATTTTTSTTTTSTTTTTTPTTTTTTTPTTTTTTTEAPVAIILKLILKEI